MMRFLRFVGVSALGFAVDAVVLYVIVSVTAFDAFSARAASLTIAVIVMLGLIRLPSFAKRYVYEIGRVGLAVIVVITAILNYALYAALLFAAPSLQPLTALVIATAAAFIFSLACYFRLNSKR
ncbi:GtrA family protein [Rhizobium sp. BK251]|uniref:GtrA family protein n=1 Tax=Rhizobium sp. BK251 TaxID=2512125 RepID=UPI00104A3B33|nr:GtrA family protein [Rhizobium sp. BK251]TCL72065.1 hypothetical protein EV286_105326 [Rhizobium sp. BK251]